ncbi:nucleoside deaminase [Mariluticola halotolerans]|uniref:nucleoside deaminase n=1 Tax=Mariluticola halotolerans TaxID=2909283 RepID=UPI0026E12918|nr:nucleoside deaminase [Mariluticola halotolerans]UJQ94377.1 nucleoside deaminase [Mariluticola halotolerans]
MTETLALIDRLLDAIEHDIAPMTRQEVTRGNKIFGAAILLKSDLSLVIAETNNEVENPLWHGEMHAIKKLYERDRKTLPDPKDCIFLATHEPCSLCLSAITWGGYDNFYYLFSHEDSRDSFAIPHDLKILKEVFTLDPGGYNTENAYWHSHDIVQMIASLDRGNRERLVARVDDISALYNDLSAAYQAQKGHAGIPLD